MKVIHRRLIPVFALIAIFALIIISVSLFSKPAIESVLARAGFAGATVESASVGFSGTNLKNIVLGDSSIGQVDAYATLKDLLGLRLGRIVIADAKLRWPLLPAKEGSPSSAPLNIYTRDIEFTNATLFLPTARGDIPLQMNGTLNDRGPDYQLKADISTAHDSIKLNGTLTATIDKQSRRIEAHFDMNEADIRIEPAIDIKRANGWVEAIIMPAAGFPEISAQLTAGASRLYGVPLQGLTLTASPSQVLLNGQVMDNGGDIAADIKIDTADATLDKIVLAITARLKNLDALNLEKLKGQGNFALNVTAEKEKAGAWQDAQQWKNLNGTAELNAKNLTLPGLVTKAQAAAKATLALDHATRALKLQAKDASYEDTLVAIKKGTTDLTLYLAKPLVAEGRIEIGEIAQKSEPAYVVPVKLSLQLNSLSSTPGTTGFNGEITEKNGLLYAKIQGKHDANTQTGNVSLNMPPLTLMKGVNALKDIFPASEQYVQETSGTFGLSANIGWAPQKPLATSGELYLKNVSAMVQENELTDVNTVLKLENLMPLAFDHQQISVGALNVGLPLTNGAVEASMDAKRNFSLHRAEWELAKGRISSSPFTLSLDDMTTDVTLTATKLDLPELFKIAPMEGLDATGTVNGTLPLEIRKGSFVLNNGVLEAEGSGFIRYNPQEPPAFLKNPANQSIADLGIALKAFEYETLKMTLNGEVGKDQKVGLNIKGKNKDFYNGHAVALNLNVEGPLQNVLKYKPGGRQIPDNIKKQLEEYEKNHAKQ